jgi:exosortase/archaeosortase family protein
MLVAGILLILRETTWRQMEAFLAANAMFLFTGHQAYAHQGFLIYLTNGRGLPVAAFVVTSQCTVGYLVAGVLVISGVLTLAKGLYVRRIVIAAAIASIVLLFFNVVRLGIIGLFVDHFGTKVGFPIAHTYLGTFITIVSTIIAGVAYALVVLRARRTALSEAPLHADVVG